MKNKGRFWRGFWQGFSVTAIILAAIAVAVYGMVFAEKNTKATGFGDEGGSQILQIDPEEGTVLIFGKQIVQKNSQIQGKN